jgi:hypothetical protein
LATTLSTLVGCASEVGSADPPSQPPTTESTAQALSTETRATSPHHGRRCSPLECCFPSAGGGWDDNAFEDRLQALGCTTPAPYEQTATAFWKWTECRFTLGLVATVFKYASTPYYAHFVENECLEVDDDKVVVVFDPTCPTCGNQVQGPPVLLE